ncbi:MAG: hypothetical protein ACXAD7_12600 [Candidatus Kariarchaeaceae archaeon]|jgi:hypothetical protein
MALDPNEATVQAMIPLLKPHFIEHASKHFRSNIKDVNFVATHTREKSGASGQVLISTVYYMTEYGEASADIALKYFQNTTNAIIEIKNAMELEIKFKSAPEFGVPRVIFASTLNPVMIVYEGIKGTNYDEIEIKNKSREAGRLLATIHGYEVKPVDTDLYRDLSRMIGTHLATTGSEKGISKGLGYYYQRLEGANSGCNPFSDFHQSNVMVSFSGDQINKVYIIDPEFMQKGRFDRLEDMGTFFGQQLFLEFSSTGSVRKTISDINEFFLGYEEKNIENGGIQLKEMYPHGSPLPFFIAQWALMDTLDIAFNRGGDLASPETRARLNFVKFILQPNQIEFPANLIR